MMPASAFSTPKLASSVISGPSFSAVPNTGHHNQHTPLTSSLTQRSVDVVDLENKKLKARLEKLEKEHKELKRAYFELSLRQGEGHGSTLDVNMAMNGGEGHRDRTLSDVGPEEPTTPDTKGKEEGNVFYCKGDLVGHTGAVYVIRFSPKGNLLASGSFDKTVRIWNLEEAAYETLEGHTLNVSAMAWMSQTVLASGGYDRMVKVWDAAAAKAQCSVDLDGFALTAASSPTDSNVVAVGTSQNSIYFIDPRTGSCENIVKHDAMVNGVLIAMDGRSLVTGDSKGMLKFWDMRNIQQGSTVPCLHTTSNADSDRPISHLCACNMSSGSEADEPWLLGVNSYDNILRVYASRGTVGVGDDAEAVAPALRLTNSLQGHKNKNFPIQSSMYRGPKYAWHSAGGGLGGGVEREGPPFIAGKKGIDSSLLVATGSADKFCYVYDIASHGSSQGSGNLIQKLEGHTDRVYGAQFHPTQAMLATCSADFRIKIWRTTARSA